MDAQCQYIIGFMASFRKACLTVTIERCAERGSHGNEPYALEYQHTLPDAELIRFGPHQRIIVFGSRHLLFGGGGALDHFNLALSLICHYDYTRIYIGRGVCADAV